MYCIFLVNIFIFVKYLKAKQKGIQGNFKGDGWQNGGVLIVSKGGKSVLFNYVQENPAEYATNEDILKASVTNSA